MEEGRSQKEGFSSITLDTSLCNGLKRIFFENSKRQKQNIAMEYSKRTNIHSTD